MKDLKKVKNLKKLSPSEKKPENKNGMLNLTEGKPVALILRFAFPMLLGTLFQQFYGMMDTIIVGKLIGLDALAGVGSTGAINFMVNGFVIGLCSGFAIPVAQKFGAKQFEKLRKYVGNIVCLTVIFSVVMTMLIAVLTEAILRWMKTPEETFSYAFLYIFIVFLGIPTTFLYNITSCIFYNITIFIYFIKELSISYKINCQFQHIRSTRICGRVILHNHRKVIGIYFFFNYIKCIGRDIICTYILIRLTPIYKRV